jgi:hypothetical protein
MIKVYFESNSHAELVAQFNNEGTYMACLDVLTQMADDHRMVVTESVHEGELV